MTEMKACPSCDGEGITRDGDHSCFRCGGTGRVPPQPTFTAADVERAARAMFDAEWGGVGTPYEWESVKDYWLGSARVALQAVQP